MLLYLAVVNPVSVFVCPFTATLEHAGGETLVVRECDDLSFELTTSGTFTRNYRVTVECVPIGAGCESALPLFTE